MKKIFTLIAFACISLAAMAGTIRDITFTVSSPTDGKATSLKDIVLTASMDWDNFVDYDPTPFMEAIKLYKAGTDEVVTGLSYLNYSMDNYTDVEITLTDEVTTPGTYELRIPADMIEYTDYDVAYNDPDFNWEEFDTYEFPVHNNLAQTITLVVEGVADGIETLSPVASDSEKAYNLQGVSVSKNYRGIVIRGGRKVIQ